MRVISGTRRGLKLADFEGRDIRPTTDRVKENIFNIISPHVYGANVLDMFAGTGAFSIEAISRGANSAVLCELTDLSAKIVKKNLERANFGEKCSLYIGDSIRFVENSDKHYDIIFLDPPYNTGLLKKALCKIAKHKAINDEGIIVAECDYIEKPENIDGLKLIKERRYGRTYILIYRLTNV